MESKHQSDLLERTPVVLNSFESLEFFQKDHWPIESRSWEALSDEELSELTAFGRAVYYAEQSGGLSPLELFHISSGWDPTISAANFDGCTLDMSNSQYLLIFSRGDSFGYAAYTMLSLSEHKIIAIAERGYQGPNLHIYHQDAEEEELDQVQTLDSLLYPSLAGDQVTRLKLD